MDTKVEFLTKKETEELQDFLNEKRISNVRVGEILNRSSANVGYWLKKQRFPRLRAKELRNKLEEQALEGFEKIDFLK